MSTATKDLEPSLVSVVIPCYNHAHFLPDAVESVLAQTWPRFEVIVVDDGSTDNTATVAPQYPSVRYLRQSNQGLSAARNTGLRNSNGDFLVFLDADDRLRPTALEVGLRFMKMHPECAFVAGRCQHVAADGTRFDSYSPAYSGLKDYYPALLRTNFILNPASVMYRRTVLESMSPFEPSVNAAADYDLYLRIARQYPIFCYEEVIVEYRRHSANMSSDVALMFKTLLTVLYSQRGYAIVNPEYNEVYKERIQSFRSEVGSILTEQVLNDIKSGRLSRHLLYNLLVLLRWYPAGIAIAGTRIFRKIGKKLSQKFRRIANVDCRFR